MRNAGAPQLHVCRTGIEAACDLQLPAACPEILLGTLSVKRLKRGKRGRKREETDLYGTGGASGVHRKLLRTPSSAGHELPLVVIQFYTYEYNVNKSQLIEVLIC